jgi:hypothetical protein
MVVQLSEIISPEASTKYLRFQIILSLEGCLIEIIENINSLKWIADIFQKGLICKNRAIFL